LTHFYEGEKGGEARRLLKLGWGVKDGREGKRESQIPPMKGGGRVFKGKKKKGGSYPSLREGIRKSIDCRRTNKTHSKGEKREAIIKLNPGGGKGGGGGSSQPFSIAKGKKHNRPQTTTEEGGKGGRVNLPSKTPTKGKKGRKVS